MQEVADAAKLRGFEVSIRDIVFAHTMARFDDELVAYSALFGTPDDEKQVIAYAGQDQIKYLISSFKEEANADKKKVNEDIINAITNRAKTNNEGSISFDDNRKGLETQLSEVMELKKMVPAADAKTLAMLLKIEADLRVKLTEKFGAAEKSNEQYIVVNKKFNHICDYTHKECFLQTKEFAKEHWHLIDDPKYKEE